MRSAVFSSVFTGWLLLPLLLPLGCKGGPDAGESADGGAGSHDSGAGSGDAAMRADSGSGLVCTQAFVGEAALSASIGRGLHALAKERVDGDDDDDDDKYLTPDPSCRSGWRWAGREHESELMHPGADCIDCHRRSHEAPSFALAGTIYAAAKEPTDCLGVESAVIRITDAKGLRTELVSNHAGNFFIKSKAGRITLPYTAEVSYMGRTRQMFSPQCETSCNSCHTPEGKNGAPGRILAP